MNTPKYIIYSSHGEVYLDETGRAYAWFFDKNCCPENENGCWINDIAQVNLPEWLVFWNEPLPDTFDCLDIAYTSKSGVYEPAFDSYRQDQIKDLWRRLGDVPVDGDENLDEDFSIWQKGTARLDVWHWFDVRMTGGLKATFGV